MDGTGEARGGVQVIARAAAVLRALKEAGAGLSLGQIAERVGLPRSTVQRIVGALIEERLVIATVPGGGLRLGPEIGALGDAARAGIVASCRPFLTELAQGTGETADLSVLRGGEMVFLDQVPGTQRLRAVSAVGEVFPLTTTANGRACLAALPPDRAARLAQEEWGRTGAPGDLAALGAILAAIRSSGLAVDLDDHTAGLSALGFAFRDWGGDLHAISVPIPSTRFAARRAEVERALRRTRKRLEAMMAPRSTPPRPPA